MVMRLVKYYSWFILAIVLLIVSNVLGRYFFDLRFDFAVDVSWQLYGMLIMLGASYSLAKGTHIRTDIYWTRFSDRTKTLIDLGGYCLFFPAFGILTYIAAVDMWKSILIDERSSATMSQLVIWPMKIGITLGLVLLMYQGVVEVRKLWLRL
jgi:TRAP-type mannitol/chloroaromatic compound transport system permease small subunit